LVTRETQFLIKKFIKNMKSITQAVPKVTILFLSFLLLFVNHSRAGNIIFTFSQTTANGMDLFAAPGGALITNSTSPQVFFALGYVASGYDFIGKTRQNLVADISYISSTATWFNVGSHQATGGKVDISFDNGGLGYNTTTLSWAGKKLVAVVSQGVNPVGGTILDTTPLAIVRGSSSLGWDSILSPDAAPSPTNQTLNVADFSSILVGTYTSLVGNVNTSGTTKFDTITLNAIPEPSSASLLCFGIGFALLYSRRKSKV
jgi:hypothetical protein